MKHKRLLTMALSLFAAIPMAFAFAACDDFSEVNQKPPITNEQDDQGSQGGNQGSQGSQGNQGGSQGNQGQQGSQGEQKPDEKPDSPENPLNPDDEKGEDGHTHTYGSWEIVKKATCIEEGERKRTCKECDKV